MKRRSTRIVAALTLLVLLGCGPLRCGYSTGTMSFGGGRGTLDVIASAHLLGSPQVVVGPPIGFFTDHGIPFLPDEVADVFPREYDDYPPEWTGGHRRLLSGGRHVSLPLYLPALLLLVMLTFLLTRKTPPPGHCRKCGYDLTGNVSGRCPECGLVV